jgi:hypothetical protein
MFLNSNENDLEIFGFYLNFNNLNFSTLFEIPLLGVFLSSLRYEKIEKKIRSWNLKWAWLEDF